MDWNGIDSLWVAWRWWLVSGQWLDLLSRCDGRSTPLSWHTCPVLSWWSGIHECLSQWAVQSDLHRRLNGCRIVLTDGTDTAKSNSAAEFFGRAARPTMAEECDRNWICPIGGRLQSMIGCAVYTYGVVWRCRLPIAVLINVACWRHGLFDTNL